MKLDFCINFVIETNNLNILTHWGMEWSTPFLSTPNSFSVILCRNCKSRGILFKDDKLISYNLRMQIKQHIYKFKKMVKCRSGSCNLKAQLYFYSASDVASSGVPVGSGNKHIM